MRKFLHGTNRTSLTIGIAAGLVTFMLWWLMNRPGIEPSWPSQIAGYAFAPSPAWRDPRAGQFPSMAEIDADLGLLADDAIGVRTYTVRSTLSYVPRLAQRHGLAVTLGAWLSDDPAFNRAEIIRLVEAWEAHSGPIERVIVGNEVLLRADQTVDELISQIEDVRNQVQAPVGTAEPWHVWLDHPKLVEAVDFIGVHLLPYWEGIAVDRAVDYVLQRYRELRSAYPDKHIIITEVGWPSNGRTMHEAVASPANQARFLRRFLAVAETENLDYFLMEAFDQPWKRMLEGEAGAHWGVYDLEREPKFSFVAPIVPVPNWTTLAAISIGVAALLLTLLMRDSRGLSAGGRVFLAVVVYATTSFLAWLVYDFTLQYMSTEILVTASVLSLGALIAMALLLAEAHEWAESLWRRRVPRTPSMEAQRASEMTLPKVSIHVPLYNEPPEMVVASLNALARLDYPDFEVLVVDNNTPDPAAWQPVEKHCRRLGPRFRFFHVSPLDGFKAGALNFALTQTDPAAKVIGVIDSDYQVDANWLNDLVPAFGDDSIAIVQAPQDYRDGDRSLFKAMCEAEYQGFFHIGMVIRNERDAIIQHGTMTLVRYSVLEEVGGWPEWCITEDAELGLRIFEHGYSARYVPRSFGRGLMPETFVDYKKQRFRWAYGATRILRQHWGELSGLRPSKLTFGQRYHFLAGWLPWLADGLNLLFNLAAVAWTVAMVLAPDLFAPPHPAFVLLPLTLFAFKVTKLLVLYRFSVGASLRRSFAAGLSGLALSHVVARAALAGCFGPGVGFFRTPKVSSHAGVVSSLSGAREEMLLMTALFLGAFAVLLREDGGLIDVSLWSTLLVVQALPYAAAVLVSVISAKPRLPGRWVGELQEAYAQTPV